MKNTKAVAISTFIVSFCVIASLFLSGCDNKSIIDTSSSVAKAQMKQTKIVVFDTATIARFNELTVKVQSGHILSQTEKDEYKTLLTNAPEMRFDNVLWTQAQTQFSFDTHKVTAKLNK